MKTGMIVLLFVLTGLAAAAAETEGSRAPAAGNVAATETAAAVAGGAATAAAGGDAATEYPDYAVAAAIEFLEAKGTSDLLRNSFGTMIDAQIKAVPELKPYREVLEQFFTENLGFDALKNDLAKIYLREFNVSELSELLSFYRSPTGMKFAKVESALAPEFSLLIMERLQQSMPLLEKKLSEAAGQEKKASE